MNQAARKAGWLPDSDKTYPRVDHVGFGLVLGDDGKRFRTRSSDVVRLVDLLDEAKTRSKTALIERGIYICVSLLNHYRCLVIVFILYMLFLCV